MRTFLFILIALVLSPLGISPEQKTGKKVTITGKVTDAENKPVSGVNIFIDKVKTDVVTDQEGFYKIKVKPGAKEILAFSLLNGASEETIDGRSVINFKLTGETRGASEIKKDLKGKPGNEGKEPAQKDSEMNNKSVIDYKESKVPVYQDVYDMIHGRFPGVEVSGKSIKVRGTNSLNVSTEPLFVVDGVIVNSIEDVAPKDVKSIEVLKGPDATAYGTRGSNGVIIITRLTGKE
jgi:TonB-dependent SusC/RagA subfamily outer membrane receptor